MPKRSRIFLENPEYDDLHVCQIPPLNYQNLSDDHDSDDDGCVRLFQLGRFLLKELNSFRIVDISPVGPSKFGDAWDR